MASDSLNDVRDVAEVASKPMEYFSHDVSAHDDIKCQRLLLVLGIEGYGRWWLLCEYMASMSGQRIPYSGDIDRLILSKNLMFKSVDECDAFLSAIADFGLIDSELLEEGFVASERMSRNAWTRAKKVVSGTRGGKTSATTRKDKYSK